MTTDPRYRTQRWRRIRLIVLARDMNRCWVQSCDVPANVADHIEPVYAGMPDALFYDVGNLRASCKPHNLRRGHVAQFERDLAGGVAPAPRRYSIGGARNVKSDARGETRESVGFLRGRRTHDSPLPKSLSLIPSGPVTRDYSRKVSGE